MSWEHFTPSKTGTVNITNLNNSEINIANYEIGTVTTGKSRSFYGYRLVISSITETFIGNDRRIMIEALKDCAEQLRLAGFQINVAGLSNEYYESGLSFNSGGGYINNSGDPIHMMCELDHKKSTNNIYVVNQNKGNHMPGNLRDHILIEIESGTLHEPFHINDIRRFQLNGRCNVGGGDYNPDYIGTMLANHSTGPGTRLGETVRRGGANLFVKHDQRGIYSLNYDN